MLVGVLVMLVTTLPPIVTEVAAEKLVPVSVIVLPPISGPLGGDMAVIAGLGMALFGPTVDVARFPTRAPAKGRTVTWSAVSENTPPTFDCTLAVRRSTALSTGLMAGTTRFTTGVSTNGVRVPSTLPSGASTGLRMPRMPPSGRLSPATTMPVVLSDKIAPTELLIPIS